MALGVIVALAGCKASEAKGSALQIERNGTPASAFALDISFENLPGSVRAVEAMAHYLVENAECVEPLPFSGALVRPDYALPLKVKILAKARYEIVYHEDALVDADYFGRGLCRWVLKNIVVRFGSSSTTFIASYSIRNADHAEEQRAHFLHRDYFRKPPIADEVFGEKPGFHQARHGPQFQLIFSSRPMGRRQSE